MRAVILAAGRGSRMGAQTERLPKCLVRLGDKSLLEWQLEALRRSSVTDITVVRGYQPHLIDLGGVRYVENPEWDRTNMVYSLLCAEPVFQDGTVLVSYADIVYGASVITKLARSNADIAITYDGDWHRLWSERFTHPLSDAETFKRAPNGFLVEIGRRPKDIAEVEGQYMGLLRFSRSGWKRVKALLGTLDTAQVRALQMTELLQLLIQGGTAIQTVPVTGGWCEVDTVEDLDHYNRMLETQPAGTWHHDWR